MRTSNLCGLSKQENLVAIHAPPQRTHIACSLMGEDVSH
jgi:hypothetical protein